MENSRRVAVVTGAAVRLGRELALHLARSGFDIGVHFNGSVAQAEDTAAQIQKIGRRAVLIRSDFRSTEAAAAVEKIVRLEFGSLNLLVNSAGIWPEPEKAAAGRSIEAESIAGWDEAINIGARAPFFMIQYLAPLLGAATQNGGDGQVINILDRSISVPFLDRAAHTVAKNALLAVTRLAAGSYHRRFRVNALELGSVLPQDQMPAGEKNRKNWIGVQPVLAAVDRILGDPSMNGETITVL